MNIIGRIKKLNTIIQIGIISICVVIFNLLVWISNVIISWKLASLSFSSMVIVYLFVIAYLASKPSSEQMLKKEFWNSVLTFWLVVFLENSIKILVGSLGQLLVLGLYPVGYIESGMFAIYTLVFFALWAEPLLRILLIELDIIYVKAFTNKLARRLQRMKEHYLVVGYGRFGKTVINDLFENYVYSGSEFESIYSESGLIEKNSEIKLKEVKNKKDPALLLERMLNERRKEILFCTNLVILDKDESLFSNVFTHPNIGKIGVVVLDRLNCLKNDKENYKKKVYIPAIVGDAKNYSTIDFAGIGRSKVVISLVPDEEVTHRIFEVVKHKPKKGIIIVPATSQQRLLIPQSCDTNIDFLHGYRIRGWELGDIVASALLIIK